MGVTCITQDGLTALHLAAKTGNMETVRYLVLSGADVDEFNEVTDVRSVCQSLNLSSRVELQTRTHAAWQLNEMLWTQV